jgi:hypothetical protein
VRKEAYLTQGENTSLGKVFTRLPKRFTRLANSLASEEILVGEHRGS